ncbi:BnaCnng10980D [Brassica napus]|uniref:BnaCnng10980D protein n=1 Tax=Brassica napus TaxID=3708 RepID=A0A078HXE0_BRANA|nr:BnaCnng10980D [Brassica napus]
MWNKLFDTAVGKLTVLSVLRMLGNEYLAVEKRLPLALIALVDGVLCPSNKDLKLTPRYVEMLRCPGGGSLSHSRTPEKISTT